ncbi:MAG: helix-hairpin-helix domain-containing protein [Acidimicrobiia bacterium]
MAQEVDERSRDEHEFWDRRFDDPDDRWVAAALATGERVADPVGPPPRSLPRPLAPEPGTGWRRAVEWVRDRRGDPRLGVVVLVVVAVIAGLVWYRIGLGSGDATRAAPSPTRARSSADASPPASTVTTQSTDTRAQPDARVVVHVAGAVVHPGVVELAAKARVIDALEAVGGATPDADVDRLNLAAPIVDGSRIYVPRRGEADPGVLDGGSAGGATDSAITPGTKLNLNTATEAQLEALPGIGPTYAQAIVAERTRRGGFRSVNELREVHGIGDKRFAELAPLVTV